MDQPTPYHPPLVPPAYARAVSGRVRTGETWAVARQMYADGATASEVMERLGIGRSAFYERARREGWLRRDQIDEPLQDEYDLNPAQVERGAAEMAVEAWACVCRAIDRGRLAEARGWTRVFRELREVAVAQAKGAMVVRLPGDGGPVETAYVPPEEGRPAELNPPEPDSADGPDSFSGVRSPGLSPSEPGSSR